MGCESPSHPASPAATQTLAVTPQKPPTPRSQPQPSTTLVLVSAGSEVVTAHGSKEAFEEEQVGWEVAEFETVSPCGCEPSTLTPPASTPRPDAPTTLDAVAAAASAPRPPQPVDEQEEELVDWDWDEAEDTDDIEDPHSAIDEEAEDKAANPPSASATPLCTLAPHRLPQNPPDLIWLRQPPRRLCQDPLDLLTPRRWPPRAARPTQMRSPRGLLTLDLAHRPSSNQYWYCQTVRLPAGSSASIPSK